MNIILEPSFKKNLFLLLQIKLAKAISIDGVSHSAEQLQICPAKVALSSSIQNSSLIKIVNVVISTPVTCPVIDLSQKLRPWFYGTHSYIKIYAGLQTMMTKFCTVKSRFG